MEGPYRCSINPHQYYYEDYKEVFWRGTDMEGYWAYNKSGTFSMLSRWMQGDRKKRSAFCAIVGFFIFLNLIFSVISYIYNAWLTPYGKVACLMIGFGNDHRR